MEQNKLQVENLLTTVMDEMLEGFQVIGKDWKYLYVNDTVAKQGKTSKEALLGKTMMEAYPGIEKTFLFSQLTKTMNDRTSIHMENEFTYADGTNGWFQLYIQPCDPGVLILSVDITDKKTAEQNLHKKINQINELADIALNCEQKIGKIKGIMASIKELEPNIKDTIKI